MSSVVKPEAAFILSLIGGVLILLGGGISLIWFTSGGLGFGGMMGGGFGGMMGGFQGMMGGVGFPFGFMSAFSLLGLAAGILVIIGAIMINSRPAEHGTWGIMIIVFSILSFFGMGGFFIGAILGLVGGALAISWAPRKTG